MTPDDLDDDSFLSAYLDDELDADARREAEARMEADPGSAEQLASLGRVRRLVGDLPRPDAPCRLASAVLAGVARAESARARRPVYWVATAASLGFACALAYRSGLIDRPAPDLVAGRTIPRVVPIGLEAPVGDATADVDDAGARPGEDVVPAPLGPASDADAEARRRLVAMLDGPAMGRVLVPAAADDEDVAGKVEELLRNSARKEPEYVRLAVPAGLGVDPSHPEGGEVIVARMDARERREFVERLGRPVEIEPEVAPTLGTELAELGGLALGTGPSGAGLRPATVAARMALRNHPEEKAPTGISERPAPGRIGDPLLAGPVVVQEEEPADHEFVGPPAPPGPRKAGPRPSGPGPVVIWILPAGDGAR